MKKTRAERYEAVCELRRQGLIHIEIAERLGISRSYVGDLLLDPTGEKVRARKDSYRKPCPECGTLMDGSSGAKSPTLCLLCARQRQSDARYWTRERIIESIQRWTREHDGVPPSAPMWRSGGEYWPPSSTVYSHKSSMFNSWNEAIVAAGFEPRPYHWWTRELVVDCIRRWNEKHGQPPSLDDWKNVSDDNPTAGTVYFLFDSWPDAVRAAGLEPRSENERMHYWTPEEIIVALRRWRDEYGKPPTSGDWELAGGWWPNRTTVYCHFDGWTAALHAAGFPPTVRSKRFKKLVA